MDAAAALARLGGCASWGELLGLTTAHAVKRAVRRGDIVRLRRGRTGCPPSRLIGARLIGAPPCFLT